MRHALLPAVLSGLLAFGTDQASKYGVLYGLGLVEVGRLDVFPPVLVFISSLNTGINFGLFSGLPAAAQWGKVALALAICVGVLWWGARSFQARIEWVFAGLLVGGALGNVVDRVIHGGVIDFLNMSCCGVVNPFVFNIADVWVFVGAIGLAVFGGRAQPPRAG